MCRSTIITPILPTLPAPYSPATGRMLRHGPALNTAALQKDIPAIAAVFSAYSQHPFSAQAPPPGYTAQVRPSGWGQRNCLGAVCTP